MYVEKGEVHSLGRWGLILVLCAESDDLKTIPLRLFIKYIRFFFDKSQSRVPSAKRPPRRHFRVSRNVMSDANYHIKKLKEFGGATG
jgi:hypothetical protein